MAFDSLSFVAFLSLETVGNALSKSLKTSTQSGGDTISIFPDELSVNVDAYSSKAQQILEAKYLQTN